MSIERHFLDQNQLPLVYSCQAETQAGIDFLCQTYLQRKEQIIADLNQFGAVLFRGFGLNQANDVKRFMEVFGANLLTYSGGDSPREQVIDKVYTSTSFPKKYELPLHQEMSYSRKYPSQVAFYCDVAPLHGGETTLMDARKLYQQLPSDLRDKFATKQLKYIQNLHDGGKGGEKDGFGKSWQETFETEDKAEVEQRLNQLQAYFEWRNDGSLRVEETVPAVLNHPHTGESIFFSQADQWHYSYLDAEVKDYLLSTVGLDNLYHNCVFGDDEPISEHELQQVRHCKEQLKLKHRWQQGDLILIDNLSVMHGRAPFIGKRNILVAMN